MKRHYDPSTTRLLKGKPQKLSKTLNAKPKLIKKLINAFDNTDNNVSLQNISPTNESLNMTIEEKDDHIMSINQLQIFPPTNSIKTKQEQNVVESSVKVKSHKQGPKKVTFIDKNEGQEVGEIYLVESYKQYNLQYPDGCVCRIV